jgi:antitoxin (DNA-binding transcriptional repressor) of toxin-antitoxin stability system
MCYDSTMSAEISQRELRNDSGRIMRALVEGETFIITRNGQPIGELSPLRRRRFVRAEAAIELFRSAAPVGRDRLRHDLDQFANQEATPRA